MTAPSRKPATAPSPSSWTARWRAHRPKLRSSGPAQEKGDRGRDDQRRRHHQIRCTRRTGNVVQLPYAKGSCKGAQGTHAVDQGDGAADDIGGDRFGQRGKEGP